MTSTMRFDRLENSTGTTGLDVTAISTRAEIGLVPVTPASVTVGSGTATVSSTGVVTFTGASSITLNNCFSSAYRGYKIYWDAGSPTQVDLYGQFRGGGSTVTTNYYGAGYNVTFGGAAGATNTRSAGSNAWLGFTGTEAGHGEITLSLPNIYSATYKPNLYVSGYSRPHGAAFWGGCGANAGALTDSFVISPSSSTITGTLQVYGFR